MSPTARTLKMLREQGWMCDVVEKWNAYAKVRIDLFGVIDIVAICGGVTAGIQATSGSNHSARRRKIEGEVKAKRWQEAGNELWIVSWSKKENRWRPRVEFL